MKNSFELSNQQWAYIFLVPKVPFDGNPVKVLFVVENGAESTRLDVTISTAILRASGPKRKMQRALWLGATMNELLVPLRKRTILSSLLNDYKRCGNRQDTKQALYC
jgi:hypothetical protein